jgi:hypothetical protein
LKRPTNFHHPSCIKGGKKKKNKKADIQGGYLENPDICPTLVSTTAMYRRKKKMRLSKNLTSRSLRTMCQCKDEV